MKLIFSLSFLVLFVSLHPNVSSNTQDNFFCPLPKSKLSVKNFGARREEIQSVWDSSLPQFINLSELNEKKVQLEFFYPNSFSSALRSVEDVPIVSSDAFEDFIESSTTSNNLVKGTNVVAQEQRFEIDLFCNWEFKISNSTYFLLLTFDKIIAPYSEDCAKAFVSVQKENSRYVSKWCGNRNMVNSKRKMAILSKSNVKLSVFRKGSAPVSPSTGFNITVEAVSPEDLSKHQPPLRILTAEVEI